MLTAARDHPIRRDTSSVRRRAVSQPNTQRRKEKSQRPSSEEALNSKHVSISPTTKGRKKTSQRRKTTPTTKRE